MFTKSFFFPCLILKFRSESENNVPLINIHVPDMSYTFSSIKKFLLQFTVIFYFISGDAIPSFSKFDVKIIKEIRKCILGTIEYRHPAKKSLVVVH